MKKLQWNKNKSATKLAALLTLSLIVTASITGVAFAQTPMPVPGAFVFASGNGFGSAFSDAQGFYNITTFLETGNYTVEASATGFLDTSVTNVSVTTGQETANVNVMMPASGGISGRVTDAVSGSPVPSVIVQAVAIVGDVTYGSSSITDSNGNYEIITNLATGSYNVTAMAHAGHLTEIMTGVSVTAGAMTSNVNLALDRSATISGTVTDSITSAVLEGIIIYAWTMNRGYFATAITNSSGKYTLNTDISTGTYNITALFPENHMQKVIEGVAVIAPNQYTVNLALDPSGIISGRITNAISGAGLAGAFVTASGTAGSGFATTNETGYYRITDGLGTGTYIVFASYGGGFNQMLNVVVTQGQETSNINLQIVTQPSGTISGRVTNATGNAMEGVSVNADGDNGFGSAITNSTGHYVIDTGLGTGTYDVTVDEFGFVAQTRTGVSVTVNQVTPNINFQLVAIVSGRISGRIQTLVTPIPEFNAASLMVVLFTAAAIAILVKKLATPKLKPARPL